MVFQHDWGIFFLIKELAVVQNTSLQAVGLAVFNSTLYPQHLFDRVHQAAKRSEANQNVLIKYGEYENSFCIVRFASGLLVTKVFAAYDYLTINSAYHRQFFDVMPGKIYDTIYGGWPIERDGKDLREVLQFFINS